LFQDIHEFETLSADTVTINTLLGNVSTEEVSRLLSDEQPKDISNLLENLQTLDIVGDSSGDDNVHEVRIVN